MILPVLLMLQLSAASPPPLLLPASPPSLADRREEPRERTLPAADKGGRPPVWVLVMMADVSDDPAAEAYSAITEPVSAMGNTALWVDSPIVPAASPHQLAAIARVGELK
jgi:hypothetical protein